MGAIQIYNTITDTCACSKCLMMFLNAFQQTLVSLWGLQKGITKKRVFGYKIHIYAKFTNDIYLTFFYLMPINLNKNLKPKNI